MPSGTASPPEVSRRAEPLQLAQIVVIEGQHQLHGLGGRPAEAELVEQLAGPLGGQAAGIGRQVDARGADQAEALPPFAVLIAGTGHEPLAERPPLGRAAEPRGVGLEQLVGQPGRPA